MACKNCLDKISGTCKVCELVDGDGSIKIVKYCVICGVYICNNCNLDLIKRMKAFKLHLSI